METQMKKMNTLLENIYKCVQNTNQCTSVPCRPEMFPIVSIAQLRAFQDIHIELYNNAVNYFHYIGGFNFKEAVNLCFKDSIQDSLMPLLTWFGGKENQEALYNTRLVKAIYDGICRNRHFERPLCSEFQTQMQAALRTAKERHRHRRRGTTAGGPRIQRDLWGDDREEEQEEEPENT
ncbi:uncharacterized protein LOC105183022 isoform X2 [Harpegnathos saltator]|nr:uncharacterized protein LOC105183022 isoform X2 [Harpegnathos saltator]